MKNPEFKTYCFTKREHWKRGVLDNLTWKDEQLEAPTGFDFEPLAGSEAKLRTAALAFDRCGKLHWIDRSGNLYCSDGETSHRLGRLVGGCRSSSLVLTERRIWLQRRSGLISYARRNLQLLGGYEPDRPILAIGRAAGEGVWLVVGRPGSSAALQRLDADCLRKIEIRLPIELRRASVAGLKDGKVVILDSRPVCVNEAPRLLWRIFIVDPSDPGGAPSVRMFHADHWRVVPQQLAIDARDRLLLLDGRRRVLLALDRDGSQLAGAYGFEWPATHRPIAIAAHEDLAVGGTGRIAWVRDADRAAADAEESVATFITPTLVSPEGVTSGWLRADLDAMLPAGATLEFSCASTDDRILAGSVDRLLQQETVPDRDKQRALESLLPWCRIQGQDSADPGSIEHRRVAVYTGQESIPSMRYRFSLHEISDIHLWLRVRIKTPPGGQAPRISRLSVLYPNLSYLRYLPAVYQEDERSAKQLQRFLALFESTFGDVDEAIHELPTRIDPRTAPSDWLPFLLRWLGLPSAVELTDEKQRELLQHAPELLRLRGTAQAIENVLTIATGGPVAVEDLGSGPTPWVLPSPQSGGIGARLGLDTLVMAGDAPAFSLGQGAELKKSPLGIGRVDPAVVFASRTAALRIRVAASRRERAQLEPFIRRYLRYFVPAHCRYQLQFVPREWWRYARRLDHDFVLGFNGQPTLGETTMVGCMRLPSKSDKRIGESAVLDRDLRLA